MHNTAANTVIVDDVPLVRERINRLINEMKCATVVGEADSVSSAMAIIEQCHPDLVLLDLGIPGTKEIPNGVGVLRWLQVRFPNTKTIVLTNYADQETRAACLRAGATAFLDKSSEIEQLLSTLNQICEGTYK